MKLSNFETFIDDAILQRGKDYFKRGHVKSLNEPEENQFIAEISGSDLYFVSIELNDKDEIVHTDCECPYDWSEYCKHQVAAFFALQKKKNGDEESPKMKSKPKTVQKLDLKSILSKLNKEDLLSIILQTTQNYPEIEKQLLFKYAPVKDEISSSKKLIRQYINQSKKNGFIDWRSVDYAVQGALLTLEKARDKQENGDVVGAVQLCLAVLSIVVDMLQYADDSNGTVGGVINESLSILDDAIQFGIHTLSHKEQSKLFADIMKDALHARYDGWSDWRFSLLRTCINFAGDAEKLSILEGQLESMLKAAPRNSWSANYENESIKLLLLEIYERFDEEEKAKQFIQENLQYSSFRKKVINSLIEEGEYEEVIRLCKEGEELDQEYRGLVSQWKEYRYQAYEGLGDIENQRELALEFIYKNDTIYFYKLKKLYNQDEWEKVLQKIVASFEKQPYPQSIFLEILVHENLTGKLLKYCQRHNASILQYYHYLIEGNFDEVNQIFITYIEKAADAASDRRKYKDVCQIIKKYKKACGAERAESLVISLKQKYIRRPAFLDELSKLK